MTLSPPARWVTQPFASAVAVTSELTTVSLPAAVFTVLSIAHVPAIVGLVLAAACGAAGFGFGCAGGCCATAVSANPVRQTVERRMTTRIGWSSGGSVVAGRMPHGSAPARAALGIS